MSEDNRIVPYPGRKEEPKTSEDKPSEGKPNEGGPKSGEGAAAADKPRWKKKAAWKSKPGGKAGSGKAAGPQAKPAAPAAGKPAPETPPPGKTPPEKAAPAPATPEKAAPATAQAAPAGQPKPAAAPAPAPGGAQKAPAPAPQGAAGNPGAAAPQNPAGPGTPPKPQGPGGPNVVEVRPLAQTAGFRRRHWGLLASFLLMVVAPLAVTAWYLYAVSLERYGSTTGFTVRSEEVGGASELLGGLAQFAGTSTSSDGDILFEFIQSQEMVEAIDAQFDLRALYSEHWSEDPVFSLWPDASIEDLVWFWSRTVRTSYDQSSGLIEIRLIAPEAETARTLARAVVAQSQEKINDLNETARADAMRYAQTDLDEALLRLKEARGALSAFRTRTQIIDPAADIQGQMGVVNSLQQQLAEALVEYDLLRDSAATSDPRVVQVQRRIEAIRARIAEERASFANEEIGGVGQDYPTLMSEYEGLTVDREYAEESYRAALTALDLARAKAARQSRYLATYIQPTLPQEAEFPQREMILGLGALFLFLAWGIIAMIYYSLRDRR